MPQSGLYVVQATGHRFPYIFGNVCDSCLAPAAVLEYFFHGHLVFIPFLFAISEKHDTFLEIMFNLHLNFIPPSIQGRVFL